MAGQIAGLVKQEETCQEILEDIYYGAAKVINAQAKNGKMLRMTETKVAFYLPVKVHND